MPSCRLSTSTKMSKMIRKRISKKHSTHYLSKATRNRCRQSKRCRVTKTLRKQGGTAVLRQLAANSSMCKVVQQMLHVTQKSVKQTEMKLREAQNKLQELGRLFDALGSEWWVDASEWVKGIVMGAEMKALSAQIGDGSEGDGDYQLHYPFGIAMVPAHPHLMVVTAHDSNQVRVYDTMGVGSGGSSRLVCKFGKDDGSEGSGEGEFSHPWGVAVTEDSAFVVVAEVGEVTKTSPSNDWADSDSNRGAEGEVGAKVCSGRLQLLSLAVSDGGRGVKLAFVRFIGALGLQKPRGLALRSVGGMQTVLVAEGIGGHRVTEWGLENGNKVRTIGTGTGGSGDGELNEPFDVAVLPVSGQIAIADRMNHRVCIFNREGEFVRAFGGKGTEQNGHFMFPCAIAADSHGHVLVLDYGTDRLQVLSTEGTHLCTRNDLGIYKKGGGGSKGLDWWGQGGVGRLAIANGSGNNVLVDFRSSSSGLAGESADLSAVADMKSKKPAELIGKGDGNGGGGGAMDKLPLRKLMWDCYDLNRVELSEEGTVAKRTAHGNGCDTLATCEQVRVEKGQQYFEYNVVGDIVTGLYLGVVCANIGMNERERGTNFATRGEKRAWLMYAYTGVLWGNGKGGFDDPAGSIGKGDRLGVLVDLDKRVVRFFKNGVKHGRGFETETLKGPVVPAVQMRNEGTSVRLVPLPMDGGREALPQEVRDTMEALKKSEQ